MSSPIGLRDLVTAELTADAVGGLTYGAVEAVAGAISIEIKDDSGEADVQMADDVEYDRLYPAPVLGFSMDNADIPPVMRAKFFGHATDTNGVVVSSEDDIPPYRAFGFKSKKSGTVDRYVWLYKCAPVKRTADQAYKTDPRKTVERQTTKIDWEVVPTIYNGEYQAFVDSDTAAFAAAKATFFSAPYVPQVTGDIEITTQPIDQYFALAGAGSLIVAASNTPAFQWYEGTDKTYGTGVVSALTGNATATLTIPDSITAGVHYYYCKCSKAGFRDVYSEIAVVIKGAA